MNYDILLDKELVKEKLIEFLKTNYDIYKNLDIDDSQSQRFIIDVQTYLTNLVSNRFEQQVQDFYLNTQETNKIHLLLSQYGYERSLGIPSQCVLKLEFSLEQMYELNELDVDVIFIPPLVLRVKDDNGNNWVNKSSILVIKTPETFQYDVKIMDDNGNTTTVKKDFYKYKMTSFVGVEEIPFIQMDYRIERILGSGKRFEKLQFLNQQDGYPLQNYFINDYINIDMKIYPLVIDPIRSVNGETVYKLHDTIKEFVQSKYYTDEYEKFVKNQYMALEYDEVDNVFNIINGDNENSGYNLNGELYLGFYRTKGENIKQLMGSVNSYQGLMDYVMLNGNLFYLNTQYEDLNLKSLFIPNKVVLKKNLKTGEILSEDQINNQDQQIFLQDLFNLTQQNEVMSELGWRPLNILVTQVEPVIKGRGQEKLEEVKYNFSQFLKQKDKIVTSTDMEQYLTNFLMNKTYSLNQVSTYQQQLSYVTVDKIRNVMKILPLVIKTNRLKDITFPKGSIIYPSELNSSEEGKSDFRYTYEKKSIIDELKRKVIQTMEVEYQDWEMLKIYTGEPIYLEQLDNVSINTILQQIKDQLNQIVDLKNKQYDPLKEFNFLNLLIQLKKINGLKPIQLEKFLNQIKIKGVINFNSKYIFPLEIQRFKDKTDKIKTYYIIPINPHQDDEEFLTDNLRMYMFNNEIAQTQSTGATETSKLEKEYTQNYIYPQPVNIQQNIEVETPTTQELQDSNLINLNYLVDTGNSKVRKYKDRLTFNKDQVQVVYFRVKEFLNEVSLKDRFKYAEGKDTYVDCDMNIKIVS